MMAIMDSQCQRLLAAAIRASTAPHALPVVKYSVQQARAVLAQTRAPHAQLATRATQHMTLAVTPQRPPGPPDEAGAKFETYIKVIDSSPACLLPAVTGADWW